MENKNILNLISFTNYDNVEINENLKVRSLTILI